jgi:protein TonB
MTRIAEWAFLFAALQVVVPVQAASPPSPLNAGQWISLGDYPLEALVLRQQGTVAFRVEVNGAGMVTGCTITQSSGTAVLDSQTCALAFQRARFAAAKDDNGEAAAGTFSSKVQWVLPEGIENAPKPIELGDSRREYAGRSVLYVDTQGIITRCQRAPQVYGNVLALPSICDLFPENARYGPPALRRGKPIKRKITLSLEASEEIVR